jgi:hypothetical protein
MNKVLQYLELLVILSIMLKREPPDPPTSTIW